MVIRSAENYDMKMLCGTVDMRIQIVFLDFVLAKVDLKKGLKWQFRTVWSSYSARIRFQHSRIF